MRFNIKPVLTACLHALLFSVVPCLADDKRACDVSVAALSLPDGTDGLVHWRTGNTPTTPLQLSTRYFSEHLKLPGNVIQFFKDPVLAGPASDPPPEPLVTLKIPAGQKLVYIVLSSELDEKGQPFWRGSQLNAGDWKMGSMKLFNACSEPVGIAAGKKQFRLLQGKSMDFHVHEWGDSFPVKIVRLEPKMKTLFSSSWRVTAGRRELCFIGNVNGSVALRSLMDLGRVDPDVMTFPASP